MSRQPIGAGATAQNPTHSQANRNPCGNEQLEQARVHPKNGRSALRVGHEESERVAALVEPPVSEFVSEEEGRVSPEHQRGESCDNQCAQSHPAPHTCRRSGGTRRIGECRGRAHGRSMRGLLLAPLQIRTRRQDVQARAVTCVVTVSTARALPRAHPPRSSADELPDAVWLGNGAGSTSAACLRPRPAWAHQEPAAWRIYLPPRGDEWVLYTVADEDELVTVIGAGRRTA